LPGGAANRLGYGRFSGYQLKLVQEVVTLTVFVIFAYLYLGESLPWNHAAAFACLVAAVGFAFWASGKGRNRQAVSPGLLISCSKSLPPDLLFTRGVRDTATGISESNSDGLP
jgi:Putative member of DMT superfamily (DUF486)